MAIVNVVKPTTV